MPFPKQVMPMAEKGAAGLHKAAKVAALRKKPNAKAAPVAVHSEPDKDDMSGGF